MTGYVKLHRSLFAHELFGGDEFSRREAWLWLIAEAAWEKDGRRAYIGGRSVALGRGQLAHSVRYMAAAWGWSKSRVFRFLEQLKTETMIGTASETGQLVVTICNYETYQADALPREPRRGTRSGTRAGQQRDKDKEGEEGKKIEGTEVPSCTPQGGARADAAGPTELTPAGEQFVIPGCGKVDPPKTALKPVDPEPANLPAVVASDRPDLSDLPEGFAAFWSAYPHRGGSKRGRGAAVKAWLKVTKGGKVAADTIIAAAQLAHVDPDVQRGYAKDPTTWLNQGCWTDEIDPQPAPPKPTHRGPHALPDHRQARAEAKFERMQRIIANVARKPS